MRLIEETNSRFAGFVVMFSGDGRIRQVDRKQQPIALWPIVSFAGATGHLFGAF
jgi:hypothetical protein